MDDQPHEWNELVQRVIEPALREVAGELNARGCLASVSVTPDRCVLLVKQSPAAPTASEGQFALVREPGSDTIRVEELYGTADQPTVRDHLPRSKPTAALIKMNARAFANRVAGHAKQHQWSR
jgi:hypothetical protein